MSKISFVVEEKSFEREILRLVKGKVVNVLRNDKPLVKAITERIDQEVVMKTNSLLNNQRIEGSIIPIMKRIVEKLLPTLIKEEVRKIVKELFTPTPQQLKMLNKQAMIELFKEEIDAIKKAKTKPKNTATIPMKFNANIHRPQRRK